MLNELLELATQPMLVMDKGMIHLQPRTAVASDSKLKLLQGKHGSHQGCPVLTTAAVLIAGSVAPAY